MATEAHSQTWTPQETDDRRHAPAEHDGWQESIALLWLDPTARGCAYQHLYLRPADGVAVLWAWHLDDAGVHGSTAPAIEPLPVDDLDDLALDAFRARLAGVAVARDARQLAAGEPDERRAA